MKGSGLLIMSKVVLDASALLALLHQEKGIEQVVEAITEAIICSVNYAEVVSKLSEGGMPFYAIRDGIWRFAYTPYASSFGFLNLMAVTLRFNAIKLSDLLGNKGLQSLVTQVQLFSYSQSWLNQALT